MLWPNWQLAEIVWIETIVVQVDFGSGSFDTSGLIQMISWFVP